MITDPHSQADSVWKLLGMILFTAAILAGVSVVVAQGAFEKHGTSGATASYVAAGLCWVTSTVALVVVFGFRKNSASVSGLLVSIIIRTLGPLCLGHALGRMFPDLAEAGLFGFVVIHYLVSLLLETVFAVRILSRKQKAS